jgi:hypothetical protein
MVSCPGVEAVLDRTCWTGRAGPVRAADHFLERADLRAEGNQKNLFEAV